MTSESQPQPAPTRRFPVREVVGLVLLLCSVVGLIAIGFGVDPLLGAALLCVLGGVVGALLCSSTEGGGA